MKTELLCFLLVCMVVAHGNNLHLQNKGDRLLKVLLRRDEADSKQSRINEKTSSNARSFQAKGISRQNGALGNIQSLLYGLVETLDLLKDHNSRNSNEEGIQQEIDDLAREIAFMDRKLKNFPAEELQTSILDLLFQLQKYENFGEQYLSDVLEIYDNGPHNEPSHIAEEYETTGNNIGHSTTAAELSRIAKQVRAIGNLIADLDNGDWESNYMIQAMIAALQHVPLDCTKRKYTITKK